jgi:hypothetical protein
VILAPAERGPVQHVAARLGLSRPTVWRWQQRLAEEGVDGLLGDKTRNAGKPPLPVEKVSRVVALTYGKSPSETTHWTGHAMAAVVGISLRSAQRIWEEPRLQAHRVRSFKRSRDPRFSTPDLGIVVECGRELLLRPDPEARPPGRVRSIIGLHVATSRYLAEHNANPKPFVWTASAASILAKLDRLPVACVGVRALDQEGIDDG